MKLTTLDDLKDKHLGKIGTPTRDNYEQELKIEFLAEEIKALRIANQLTQDELGELIGVQRAQISKIENGKTNITIGTLLKVFNALKAKINFSIETELQT
ncbi:helix-turn-helix domain-containing protein [Portibacter lacus]|uniref:Transcriptional regulator n=1 Tax=Portibacter lacus TaxID=1099794 RepID=A0AA37SP42_9BACT|nr:helix-turn-helix transcriptional regulator [Portibacter lacus]GLR18241.1 transcriptional regulator [Portibacter lacus]